MLGVSPVQPLERFVELIRWPPRVSWIRCWIACRFSSKRGSEFAAEFEEACQQKELPLFVLLPKSPKLNAHVERSHRTHNEEFYEVQAESDQVPVLNRQLLRWEKTYSCVRPHQSLAYLTPLEFITRWKRNQRKAKCH